MRRLDSFCAFFKAFILLLPACVACGPAVGPPSEDLVRATNLGKAYLENRESRPAVEAFSEAVELGRSAPALRNLARAYLLARNEEAVLKSLEGAVSLEGKSVATSYLTGLALARQGKLVEALTHFEEAVRLDPHTAALRFQLANAYQAAGNHESAVEQLRATVDLDPLHTGAHYRLAAYARRSGDRKELEARQRELKRLRAVLGEDNRTPEALERCVYTQAETVPEERSPSSPALEVLFTDMTRELFADAAHRAILAEALAMTVADVDETGRVRLFVATSSAAGVIVTGKDGPETLLSGPADVSGSFAVSGNYHDKEPEGVRYDPAIHAHSDVLVLGAHGARLLAGGPAGAFEDVTAVSGLGGLEGRRARWVDYEHDGDLDLAVAGEHALELWQNNGDGRFEEVSAAVGVVSESPVWDVAAVDLDGNLAVDLVVARGEAPTLVFENRRTGLFRKRPEPPGPWPAARRVLADDLDGDARPDVVLVGSRSVVVVHGGSPERPKLDLSGLDVAAAALTDHDNDGFPDLLVGGAAGDRGRLRLWRNLGSSEDPNGSWEDVTEATGLAGLDLAAVRDVTVADFDHDGDTDLAVLTTRGLRFLSNEGAHVRSQLKLRLLGTKTNPSGLGTRVEVRRGRFRTSRTVTALPVEIGLGGTGPLDSLQVVWTNGIVDNKVEVPVTAQPVTLIEKNVAAGSCPFLYAWDGQGFRFVTDVLGNSPVGLSIARGVPLDADPDELVVLGSDQDLVARDGAFVVQVTEEMREVLYLDHARLVAVDHPPLVEVHTTDKLMPAPFPPSEIVALGALHSAGSAVGDDGVDRTEALRAVDGDFAPPGVALRAPFRGMTRTLALTLDFGTVDVSRPLVLALTGWLQYGDASTNIALSQGPPERVVPPRLEAAAANGAWHPIDVVVGMPAGKTKTILVDLEDRLPASTRRLRLTTSFEIRWDRVVLGERLPPGVLGQHPVLPIRAELGWRGFSEIHSRAPGHPTTPAFDAVSPRPPWRTALRGWTTRYGDVLELVAERDERLVIINAGDALELAFDAAALPPVPVGRLRTFFFYSVGWDKDGDVNVIDGDTVDPLPVAATQDDWQVRYNTRWVPWNRFE